MATVEKSAIVAGELGPHALNALEWAAVAVAARAHFRDHVRDQLAAGRGQAVDVTLRIFGEIDIAEDTTNTKASRPQTDLLLGFVLSLLGPRTRKAVAAAIRALPLYDGLPPIESELHREAKSLVEHLTTRAVETSRGAVRGALVVHLVDERAK